MCSVRFLATFSNAFGLKKNILSRIRITLGLSSIIFRHRTVIVYLEQKVICAT